MPSFAEQVRRGHENARQRVQLAVRRISITAVNDIILISPVDTGRFRGNWQASIGSVNFSVNDAADPTGQRSLSDADFVISGFDEGQVFFFSNSLPYARRLEFGHSLQAPSPPGIVRRAAQRARETLNTVFGELRP